MNYLLCFEQHQVQKLSWQYSMSRFGTTLCFSLVYLKFQFQGHVFGLCWANARINNFCNKAWWLLRSSQFWFRIVNMCKTLSQIKRLGKYFQRWSERKDFAQVSMRPRKWERNIKKYWKHFQNSLNKASPSAGGGVRAKPEKNLPARSICHQRFENLELGLVFHFYLL